MPSVVPTAEGRRKGGRARAVAINAEKAAHAVLGALFKPEGDLKEALASVGITPEGDKFTLMAGILAVHAGRALNGDLNSAKWVFDVAGITLNAKEQKAKIKALRKQVEPAAVEAVVVKGPEIPTEEINESLKNMGVFDDGN